MRHSRGVGSLSTCMYANIVTVDIVQLTRRVRLNAYVGALLRARH